MPPKKLVSLLTIVVIIITGIFMLNWFKKSDSSYQEITLEEIEASPEKYDEKKVLYYGLWTTAFEVSNLDGKIWLEADNKIIEPIIKSIPVKNGQRIWTIAVFGTLQTKQKHYGHLGLMPYQIIADKIEIMPDGSRFKILDVSR